MARLIWTEPALADLEAIAEVIALDKPDAAKKYTRRVFEAVARLGKFPNSGSIPPEIPDLAYRQLVVPPCRIFYRTEKGTVYILFMMRSEQLFREEWLEKKKRLD